MILVLVVLMADAGMLFISLPVNVVDLLVCLLDLVRMSYCLSLYDYSNHVV
ncbi:hypothetical protein HanXRQr2_Chr17g0825611 [Helianthus annuus]|uniref:Uncharacterized protein n=1 Tax=Helianthus annuus TaxID=4232 RepID=A0A9K3DKZ7_HELAN|nr:hypothetical protein HanXRQr2_Chr17g0825611 [Helianthus annuus]